MKNLNQFPGKWIANTCEVLIFFHFSLEIIMDILLINPAYIKSQNRSEIFERNQDLIKNGNMYVFPFEPPLGLASILSALKQKGIDSGLLDMQAEKFELADLELFLVKHKPGYVGISAMTTTYPAAKEIARLVKGKLPNCRVILGGVHPTIMPEETIKESCFDYIVCGEAEESLVQLLTNGSPEGIDGIGYRDGSKYIIPDKTPHLHDLDLYPMPDYNSFPVQKYVKYNQSLRSLKAISMIVSRGCPYPCSFCAVNQTMGQNIRFQNHAKVVSEMQFLQNRYALEGIWFKDSIFNMNKKWVKNFCDEIINRNLKIKWQINTRVDLIGESQLEEMVAAGLSQIDIGIESGSPKSLKTLKKNITVNQIGPAVSLAQKQVKVSGFFMIGIPGETEEDITKTFELAKRLELDKTSWSIFTPLPGSLLFNNLRTQGRLPKDIDWSKTHFIDSDVSYSQVPHEKLIKSFHKIQEYFSSN